MIPEDAEWTSRRLGAGARPSVYAAKPKLRKEYADLKKDVTSLKPKPQRLKQRVIPETNHEDRVRSTRDSNLLKPRMKYEPKMKPRIRPEQRLETDHKVVPDTRPKKIVRSEAIVHHKIKPEVRPEYKVKLDAKSDPKMKPEVKPEPKIKPKAKPELKIKQETKPEIKEKSDSIGAEQKVGVESKMKPGIVKSDQKVKEIKSEQKPKSEIISELKVKPEISKLDQKLKVEKITVADLDINDGATPIEDIIEEQLPIPKPSKGHYALNPLMTRMVEAELQDIMIKIWQELPDNSQEDGEKLVADKLRNVAGDDIRNVLGLNVTKRLLNVYNPLFVKIQFSGKPDRVNLAKFLRKYNFIAFKRIGKADVFAAQMKTIKDFDRICAAKDIMCGDVKLTVNPCYRFTKCPANLKTAFDDKSEHDEKEETVESKDVPTDIDDAGSKLESNTAKSQNSATDSIVKTKQSDTDAAKTKAESEGEPKTKESEENVTETPAKSETNIVKTESDKTPVKANATKNTKAAITKPIATNSEKNITISKSTMDTQSKSNKVENKETNKKQKESKVKGKHSKKTEESDNDELDDHDIFALISGGIVLDECSGSDEE